MASDRERGQKAEDWVQRAFEKQGYRLIRKRWRTPLAEIDLFMAGGSGYLMVEVKTLSRRGFVESRVSVEQRRRLMRAREFLQDRCRAEVRLVFAFVEDDGKILLFNPLESDLH